MNKFAYIHNIRIPSDTAHSIYIAKTCEASSKLGIKTYLIVSSRGKQNEANYWYHYNIDYKLFTILRTRAKGIFNPWMSYVVSKFAHPLATLLFAIEAVKITNRHRIGIIQTCDPEVIAILSLVRSWYCPKIIFDMHIDPPAWLIKYKNVIDEFVVNTNYFKQWLVKNNVSHKRIIESPNGYSPNDYEFLLPRSELKKKIGITKIRKTLGYIGRYETLGVEKGIFQLLKVGSILKKQLPITVLLVGGPDNQAQEYKKYADELGYKPDEIVIHHQVSPQEVPQYIAACDIGWLVYPDNPRFRNAISPMKVLEYGAAKVPIIASNFPSITNQFSEEYIYLVEPADTANQITTILEILSANDSQKTKKLYDYIQQYSWINRQRRILKIKIP